jgi:hypothetical protein
MTVLLIHAALAQGAFRGAWNVVDAQRAPWVNEAADRSRTRADSNMLHARVAFLPNRIDGPQSIACRNPHCQVVQAPLDELFEGGLADTDRGMTDPMGAAATLGFRGLTSTTLRSGCELEFHMVDENTALFGLNNIIYTLRRSSP